MITVFPALVWIWPEFTVPNIRVSVVKIYVANN